MRLAGQARGGFYAAAPEAVAAVLERLRPPAIGECLILDPCAGLANALLQLADGLGDSAVPYAVELSEDRAAVVKALLDDQALAPADFLRTVTTYGTFSLIWANPPYDYAAGSDGRMELQFVRKAVGPLVDGGVLCMVCPQSVAEDCDTINFFEEHFEAISALPFPKEVRKYEETVILGRKRRSPAPLSSRLRYYEWLDRQMTKNIVYQLPPGHRPKVWKKTEPTDTELARMVAASPLRFMIDRPTDKAGCCARPPMSIGIGHRALLLASGFCDGLIQPPNAPPHLVRGTCGKETYVASCTTEEDDDGNSTTKTVLSEKPRLCLRVMESDGTLTTLE